MEIVNCSSYVQPEDKITMKPGKFWSQGHILAEGGGVYDEDHLEKHCQEMLTYPPDTLHLNNMEGEMGTRREPLQYFIDTSDPSQVSETAVSIRRDTARYINVQHPSIRQVFYMLPENSGAVYWNPKKWGVPVMQREVDYLAVSKWLPDITISAYWPFAPDSISKWDRAKWTTQTESEISKAKIIHGKNPYITITANSTGSAYREPRQRGPELEYNTFKFILDSCVRWRVPIIYWDWTGHTLEWWNQMLLWQYSK